jgi:hypothetical protein
VYDGSTAASVNTAGAVLGGLVAGDAVSVSATGAFSDQNVGVGKTVTLASSYGGADVGNYTIAGQAGTAASVLAKPLVVSANPDTKVNDGKPYSGGAGVTYSGFVPGETFAVLSGSLAYGGSSQGANAVGSYAIAPSGLGAANYAVSFVDGLLTITEAPLPAQSLSGALAMTQSLLREPRAERPSALRLLICSGSGAPASDVTCLSAQRPDASGDSRQEAARPTLRIVDGGIGLPRGTSVSKK